jgi:hypothetical protein
MEAVRTSEMSVNFNVTTRRYIPEESEIQTCCRENLKFHTVRLLKQSVEWQMIYQLLQLCSVKSHNDYN